MKNTKHRLATVVVKLAKARADRDAAIFDAFEDDMTAQEIATITGMSYGNVRKIVRDQRTRRTARPARKR